MQPLANVNGVQMPLSEVRISALDRGFLFGDAVYEVLRVYAGKPWLADEHLERLDRSLKAVRIAGVDLGRLRRRMTDTISAGKFREATVYIQVTRGAAPRAHSFPAEAVPLELLFVSDFADPYAAARNTGAAVLSQPDIRWDRCDIKSTNLLANVLAMQAAKEAGCAEALLFLPDGTLTEGTHTSFFGVGDGAVITAPRSNAILPGVTRGLVLRLADRAGISTVERVIRRQELADISELFLTGTTSEVLPIVRLDGRLIGNGQPGPVTRRLQKAYQETVHDFLASSSRTGYE